MRSIKVVLHDDESVQVTPEKVYMGEHRAARLEITLPQRLLGGFAYYNLCFDVMGSGKRVPLGNIYAADEQDAQDPPAIAWMDNGEIVCELPESLTQSSFLRAQVEACMEEDGICTRLEKSAPFVLAFADSIAGEGDALSAFALDNMAKLMAQINRLRRTLRVQVRGAQEEIAPLVAQAQQAAQQAEQAAERAEALGGEAQAQWQQIQNLLQQATSQVSDQLMAWWEEGLQSALSGVCVQHITAGEGATALTLLPGVRYRIAFEPGAERLSVTLDDTEASAEFAQEFSLAVTMPDDSAPEIELMYLSGEELLLPADFVWTPGGVTELHVLDGLAAASRWEAAA